MHLFEQALDLTLESLRALRRAGRTPTASLKSLRSLQGAKPGGEVVKPLSSAGVVARESASGPAVLAHRPDSDSATSSAKQAAAVSPAFEELRNRVLACTKCPHLVESRSSVVFGVGNPQADLMFVGEAPGAEEDLQGEPFVGAAGQLLTKIIGAMGFTREDVFIANVLKCRPDMPPGVAGNRRPTPDEMATCLPYLREQIALVKPRVIVALGAVAMEGLFGQPRPIGSLRGRWHDLGGTPVMPTYHPAYLLRNQAIAEKRKVWEDMLAVLEFLEIPITPKQYSYFKEVT